MPTISGIPGPYRFFFYSLNCREPPHIHVERDGRTCKWWLARLELARNAGLSVRELEQIRRIILKYHDRLMEEWHAHCRQSAPPRHLSLD
jgi:hypothetical protein